MRELNTGYRAEVDTVDENGWYRLLNQFDDANIYQTWSYDEVRSGRTSISHLVLRKDGEIAAIAQARIVRVPLLKAGIAYVRWGPLWKRHERIMDPEVFRQALRALRNEYACRRGLVLRLYPIVFREDSSVLASLLDEEGFSGVKKERADRTLILELNQSLEVLREGLRPHWQRELKVAERKGLEVVDGADVTTFERFIEIYQEMLGRKRFKEGNDIEIFKKIQKRLPESLKMKILLGKSGEQLCAGLVCSAIGETAVYLFGATGNSGMKSRGSYLLQWKLIEWLKERGVARYDLHGIDPVGNPGTYRFKADLCGNNGRDVHFLGRLDAHNGGLSHSIVTCGDGLRRIYGAVMSKIASRVPGPSARASITEQTVPRKAP